MQLFEMLIPFKPGTTLRKGEDLFEVVLDPSTSTLHLVDPEDGFPIHLSLKAILDSDWEVVSAES